MVTIEEIVKKNLALIYSSTIGGMFSLSESIGGNAGIHEGRSCYGANFYYHPQTGEILYFGNYQDVPKEIRENFPEGTFRVAVGNLTEGSLRVTIDNVHKIVQLFMDSRFDLADKVLRRTVAEFNSKQKTDNR